MLTVHKYEKKEASIPVKPVRITPRIPLTEESSVFFLDCSEGFYNRIA